MKRALKLIIVCLICIISIAVLFVAGLLVYGSFTSFHPNDKEALKISNQQQHYINHDTLNILSWNIGYAGLGREMDFFYEGGEMTRPEKENATRYLNGILATIKKTSGYDFVLLQEVDVDSKRSYHVNQVEAVAKVLQGYAYAFAYNYKAGWVPVPLNDPMGKVQGGMVTFSDFKMNKATRLATPGKNAWPERLFTLKRCLIKTTHDTENGKKLVIFNIHNSAFGHEAELRKQELGLLKELFVKEYNNGNYVIIGGDWNQNPPGMDISEISKYKARVSWPIEKNYLPESWVWAYDSSLPTNRDVDQYFDPMKTSTTILDFFAVSPNVEVIDVKTNDLEFANTDHHPVSLKVVLK